LGKYRDKLRIIADVLSIVNERPRKTQIMYKANLSYTLVCRYLSDVLAAGLVFCDHEDCYVLTSKGKEFLSRYEEYSKFCKSLEEQSNRVNSEKDVLERMVSNDNGPHVNAIKGRKAVFQQDK